MLPNTEILARIDAILARTGKIWDEGTPAARECTAGALGLVEAIYGRGSVQLDHLTKAIDHAYANLQFSDADYQAAMAVRGALTAIRVDVENGRLGSIIQHAVSEVLIDFLELSDRALSDGRIDVAAVLAAASLEDAIRRKAVAAGISVENKDLSALINTLKAAGLLGGPQAKIISSYVTFRNKAMHADWSKLQAPEVSSLIAFLKQFLLQP